MQVDTERQTVRKTKSRGMLLSTTAQRQKEEREGGLEREEDRVIALAHSLEQTSAASDIQQSAKTGSRTQR